jgi:hypothetical protein
MKLRHQRAEPHESAASNVESGADTGHDVLGDDQLGDDLAGAGLGHGPHHDPSVHAEREPFAVTTQRCRGEYP